MAQAKPIIIIAPAGSAAGLLWRALRENGAGQEPPPGLLAPLLHFGYWRKVYHAPYDHVLAAEAQRLFISKLPEGEADYVAACRAYADRLYAAGGDAPADAHSCYAGLLPLIAKVLPGARYLILTRNPVYGLYQALHGGEPRNGRTSGRMFRALEQEIRAVAWLQRERAVPAMVVRYADLVAEPNETLAAAGAHLGLDLLVTDAFRREVAVAKQERRAATQALAARDDERRAINAHVSALSERDCALYGYPYAVMWEEVSELLGRPMTPMGGPRRKSNRRRWLARQYQRAARIPSVRRYARKALLTADVLLRRQS